MAERSKASEQSIAQRDMGFANRLQSMSNERIGERQSHVGYYLVGGGRKTLQREIGYWPTLAERLHGFVMRWPDFSYILAIEVVTFLLIAAAVVGIGFRQMSGFAGGALLLLPAAGWAVALFNQIAAPVGSP